MALFQLRHIDCSLRDGVVQGKRGSERLGGGPGTATQEEAGKKADETDMGGYL
jgi:hypothetical protein